MREPLDVHEAGDPNRAAATDAGEVVAAEIDEHHMLRTILLGREQALGVTVIGGSGTRDGTHARPSVLAGDEALRGRADEREPVELEQEEVRGGVDAAKRAVERER